MTERESIISLHDSSKRPNYDCDSIDRISALPDSILGFILSFLPTNNAVATSVLSKRWKFAWVTVHNLDFCCNSYWDEHNGSERMKFVRFVNRVLRLNDAGLLNKFSLNCDFGPISTNVGPWINFSSWINTAITKNVQELSLFFFTHGGQFEMPVSVFNCSSLRSLNLSGLSNVSAATVVCLPRLETLKLNGIDFQSEEAFEKFIRGCPVLNFLYLQIHQNNGFTFMISSTSLRRVTILIDERCSLNLNTSSLEYLKVRGCIYEIFVQKNLSSLVAVDFSFLGFEENHSCNSIVEALRAFDCAKTLTLSGDVFWALSDATISLSTEFKSLVELEIETYGSLPDFIQYTDNLKVLTIDQFEIYEYLEWSYPVEVARCLSNSLKTVVVYGYHGYECQHEMIRYILKHGSVLEVMQISFVRTVDNSAMLKLVKEIREFSRKSPICEVKFM